MLSATMSLPRSDELRGQRFRWIPSKLEFVISVKTAKALGFEVSDRLLALADEVIE
jgi:hypothetical protein